MPHPPIAVPEVGRGREKEIAKTLESMRTASDSIMDSKIDTIIVISPHAPSLGGMLTVNGKGELKGDLGRFGARKAAVGFTGGEALARGICDEARLAGIGALLADDRAVGGGVYREAAAGLDHGAVVPLYFVQESIAKKGVTPPELVVISVAFLSNAALYKFGGCIAKAVQKSGAAAALITSGDLSHKLTEDGPYGYDPTGPKFDEYIIDCIKKRDVKRLLNTDEMMLERAAQCGFYGLLMTYGALGETAEYGAQSRVTAGFGEGGKDASAGANAGAAASAPVVLSYEGIFGVGYAIARLF